MNTILLFVECVLVFGAVVLASRFFKEYGLVAWCAIAGILANVMTAKTAVMLGLESTLGTVLFSSIFLATDIITEKYGKKLAFKAVALSMLSVVVFIVASQIALLYAPSANDYANDSMATLFGLNLRISISSIVMFAVANVMDILIFDKIRQKTNGRKLWLRNNVATIICNCVENFLFIFLAFFGIYDMNTVFIIAGSTSIIEVVVALADTPFLYLATRWKGKKAVCQ